MSTTPRRSGQQGDRQDPTGTGSLRERFERELRRRFRRVRGLVRTTVGYENDAFGLRANAEPAETFAFPTDAQQRRAFEQWLRGALRDEVLEPADMVGVREGQHYTATYVRSSYTKALADANRRLAEFGVDVEAGGVQAMLDVPVHESSLRRLYTRAYQNLESIADDGAQVVREELTQGFAEGVNPREMARRVNGELDSLDATRARTLARTETINAYTEGTLDRYERMGVGEVTIRAEWSTAGDDRVCPICASIDGQVHSVQEVRTGTFQFDPGEDAADHLAGEFPLKPPLHPNCRCAILPSVS